MSEGKSCVLIQSGGMDSATLLYKLRDEGWNVHCLSFFYNQKHQRELDCAVQICEGVGVPWQRVDLSDINKLMPGSALTDDTEVPKGHYAADNMAITVVPSRNTIMISIASAYAVAHNIMDVFFGAHAGDHDQYPDCREVYIEAMNNLLELANELPVNVHAPFIKLDKGDIAKIGAGLNVPYELTHTCYEGKEKPCMRCGSCVERTYAFLKADVQDPLYTDEEWAMAVEIHNQYQAQYEADNNK